MPTARGPVHAVVRPFWRQRIEKPMTGTDCFFLGILVCIISVFIWAMRDGWPEFREDWNMVTRNRKKLVEQQRQQRRKQR